MTPIPQPMNPDDVLKAVREAAVVFVRDTVEHLPSGDEVRRAKEQGLPWRWMVCGYLKVPGGDTIFCSVVSNDLKPDEAWFEKAYQTTILQLSNGLVMKLRKQATKLVVPEDTGKIVTAN